MTPELWQQIREVLEKALELEPSQRSAYLNQSCSSDPSLRQEVEILLASSDNVRSSFLRFCPLEETLNVGTKIGEYEVQSLLGSGGMGQVYRARDLRLGRDLAIKVLPPFLSGDSERSRRFEQEARAAAALNHPNILAVFQMGTHKASPYLVSELLEGETLREQIKRGRLSIRKAIDYGMQITRGLAAAHEKGIIHRDLKPENLFVTKNGRVKILDFGLAKLTQPQSSKEHGAGKLMEGTDPGVVMGTVGYMSPEQVRGQNVDHRTDIFAFGAVLYEMLAGKRAFQKQTPADTMSAILNEDPPGISRVESHISYALQRAVHRCLEKNPEQRFQSASDLAFALEALPDSGGAARFATKRWRWVVPFAIAVLVLSVGGYRYYHRRHKLKDQDTIVLTGFANSTNDAVFDETLKTALSISLRQSPFLNVLSDDSVAKTLQQMTLPHSTKLTPEVAGELCQRAGGKAYLAGAIGSLGSEYVLELKAVNCQSGDILAEEQITVAAKEKVLDGLGTAASKLRGELGESLATVKRFDVPLQQATTSSLEALKAYSLGIKALNEKGPPESLPYHQRAIELDPEFALGYWAVGDDYGSMGEPERAREYFTKAFQLREHASERERLTITGVYYLIVTGELDKAVQTYQEEIQSYPLDTVARGHLGVVFSEQGQYEKSAETTRQAVRLAPDEVGWYQNLAINALALQRFEEARQIVREAESRKLDSEGLHTTLYAMAFLGADPAEMARQQQWFAGKPDYENYGLSLAADTEACRGRLGKALELTKQAVNSAIQTDNREGGAAWQADAALQQVAFGDRTASRRTAAEALRLAPTSRTVESEAALAFAMAGDETRAESVAIDLGKRFPLDTEMQLLWLPTIHAQLELNAKNPAVASNLLHAASAIELSDSDDCLYHVYVRAEAYLAAGESTAAAEFQKILDHSGLVVNCWTGALARLGVARANSLQAKTSQGADADAARVRALAAYKDFLTLWKEADPDIPILEQAQAEYARLQ